MVVRPRVVIFLTILYPKRQETVGTLAANISTMGLHY